jgi:hypothetical protein
MLMVYLNLSKSASPPLGLLGPAGPSAFTPLDGPMNGGASGNLAYQRAMLGVLSRRTNVQYADAVPLLKKSRYQLLPDKTASTQPTEAEHERE